MIRTYALEQTGKIYTEEEWWEEYKGPLPDKGVVMSIWDDLPHIDIDDEDLEDSRSKLLFTYSPPRISLIDVMKEEQIKYNTLMDNLLLWGPPGITEDKK